MDFDPFSINNPLIQLIQREARADLAKVVESEGSLQDLYEASIFNPSLEAQKFKRLSELKSSDKKEIEKSLEDSKIVAIGSVEETAAQFEERNEELTPRTLLILRDLIRKGDSPEEILAKVLSVYPDPSLADEALDFLIQTASEEMLDSLKTAKELLNRDYSRQVKAGRNMGAEARAFAKEGLGSATSLRDLYREITGNRKEPLELFDELAQKYPYKKLSSIITFLLHSLGTDMKAKGPSIDPIFLARLIEETRSLQGILGLFRFFLSRSKMIDKQFRGLGLPRPNQTNFEILTRLFVKMLAERYMNAKKIFETAPFLGLQTLAAQAIIYAQMYDAIRQVSPRYYRDAKHKQELIKAFVDTLEDLEEKIEEEKEKNQKKKKEEDDGSIL